MKKNVPMAAAVFAICLIAVFCFAPFAGADERKFDVKQGSTMTEVLGALVGAPVDLTLRSGTNLSGKVASVQQNVMVLSELRGKEFYDAVVKIEDISAVSLRVRSK